MVEQDISFFLSSFDSRYFIASNAALQPDPALGQFPEITIGFSPPHI